MKKALKCFLLSFVILIIVSGLLYRIFWAKTIEFSFAARDNDIPRLEQLIQEGYNPIDDQYFGTGILTFYISLCLGDNQKIDLKTLTYLLDKGLSPDYVSKGKPNALQLAIFRNKSDVVKLLIKRGADVNATFNNLTVLDLAIKFQHYQLIKLFPLDKAKIGTVIGKNPMYLEGLLLQYMGDSSYREVINLFIDQEYYTEKEVRDLYEKAKISLIEYMKEQNIRNKDMSKLNQL